MDYGRPPFTCLCLSVIDCATAVHLSILPYSASAGPAASGRRRITVSRRATLQRRRGEVKQFRRARWPGAGTSRDSNLRTAGGAAVARQPSVARAPAVRGRVNGGARIGPSGALRATRRRGTVMRCAWQCFVAAAQPSGPRVASTTAWPRPRSQCKSWPSGCGVAMGISEYVQPSAQYRSLTYYLFDILILISYSCYCHREREHGSRVVGIRR